MVVNGRQVTLHTEMTLSEFLVNEGFDLLKVAVEKNGGIVPKKDFADEMVSDADKLEIVNFVGGG